MMHGIAMGNQRKSQRPGINEEKKGTLECSDEFQAQKTQNTSQHGATTLVGIYGFLINLTLGYNHFRPGMAWD